MRISLKLIPLLTALVLLAAPELHAGVITFVGGNDSTHPIAEVSTPGTTYSHTEAGTTGPGATTSQSHTSPQVCTFPCMQLTPGVWQGGGVTINGVSGKGRAHAGVNTNDVPTDPESGHVEAGFLLTDTLTIDTTAPFSVALDISFNSLSINSNGTIPDDYAAISTIYEFALIDPNDSLIRWYVRIQADKNDDNGVLDEIYRITSGWDGEPETVISTGDTFPTSLSAAVLFPDPGFPPGFTIVDYQLELSLYVHATCQNLSGSSCSARISSTNSSYVGLAGAYTSQNGYLYQGLNADNPGGGEVPEPATFLLIAPALAGIMIVRRCKPECFTMIGAMSDESRADARRATMPGRRRT